MDSVTALLADIHGNAWALEAVLADAARRGVTEFIDLGDVLYGPLAPRRTYDLLQGIPLTAQVRGNQDRLIVSGPSAPTVDWVRQDLGPEPVAWLASLPPLATRGDRLLCHGTPASDTAYLLEDVSTGRPVVRPDAAIQALLGDFDSRWILCGHSHVPRLVLLASGQTVLNPGSVGLPAYDDDAPVPHFMETFSPHACYATVERDVVSFHRVPYDWTAAAGSALDLGRPDWARGIATGRME